MGIIGSFLGWAATAAGEKIAMAAVKQVAKQVAIGSLYVFGGAICAIAPNKKGLLVNKDYVIESPQFKVSIPLDSSRQQRKILKETSSCLEDLKKTANKTYKHLNDLANVKMQLLSCFAQFALYLKKIVDAPEQINERIKYDVETPTLNELVQYIKDSVDFFVGFDEIKLHVAAHGFVPFDTNNDDSVYYLLPLEKELVNIDIESVDNPKQLYRDINELQHTYNSVNRYIREYIEKLETCSKRYTNMLNDFGKVIKKNNKYPKIKRMVNGSYVSTILIIDLINTDLFDGNKINDKVLKTRMNRKMI